MKKLRLLVPVAVIVAVVLMLMAPVGALAAPNTGGHKGGECEQWYTVKCGDTIGNIAWKFGVNSTELAMVNHLKNPNVIFVGQTLCIPEGHWGPPPCQGKCDGGWDDGKKDGWDDGKKDGWDDGKKDGWDDGKKGGWDDGKKGGWDDGKHGGFKYTVKCGDTIGDIAWKFGVNSTKLAQANGLRNPNKIYVGQQLWIP